VHFAPSASSRAAGAAFLKRKWERKDRDPEMSAEGIAHQREAVGKYIATHDGVLDYLKSIHQPTLVVQGSHDVIIPTHNSYVLQQNLPNAQLIVYPDSSHGSFYQYPELFVAQATQFLDTQFKAVDGASESLPFPSLPFSH
jgi:pimeloyl-ACP methyl ester carboxylesterase